MPLTPPQTIILEPVQTAVWYSRSNGALVVVVAVQVLATGSYWPPSFSGAPLNPPQTIIFEPVQTAVWLTRTVGAPVVVVAVQALATGSYWPPVFRQGLPLEITRA